MAKFKPEILDKIKTDSTLYALVAEAMKIQPPSLGMALARNGATLNQYSIVKLVADYLNQSPEDTLESEEANGLVGAANVVPEPTTNNTTNR